MVTTNELSRLRAECAKLPRTNVIQEEMYVFEDPVLILMSSVISLNRRWYAAALPARARFEKLVYPTLSTKSLTEFQAFMAVNGGGNADWHSLSASLWKNKEWKKARELWHLTEYMIDWISVTAPGLSDIKGLRSWANEVTVSDFKGKVHGLSYAAYDQLRWYLDGKDVTKLDVHVRGFVFDVVGRTLKDSEIRSALGAVAASLRMTLTELDARIWDFRQGSVQR